MPRQPAKVLEPGDVRLLLKHVVNRTCHPERNKVLVLLSFKAGLRACEMSGLDWEMVLTSDHQIGDELRVHHSIAKKGSGRSIPVHPELKAGLKKLHTFRGHPVSGPIIYSERDGRMIARSIVNWFSSTYQELKMVGCSSHSGRRTFITASARVLAKTGGSLRDIQELAGHRALTTTERYIVGNRDAQRKLISLL
jgi:integrase/recombinase XerD